MEKKILTSFEKTKAERVRDLLRDTLENNKETCAGCRGTFPLNNLWRSNNKWICDGCHEKGVH